MNVGAANMDVSPVDKDSARDSAGHIYDASYGSSGSRGYFWTDLGHATIKDLDGKDVELYTPFIYHTNDQIWDKSSSSYNPVHLGDGSEMDCNESMSNINVGEFDRIVKALYHNDLKVYNAINGGFDEAGNQVDGLKQKMFTSITKTSSGTTDTYHYLKENGDEIGTTQDRNTTNKSLTIGKGPNSGVRVTLTDTDGTTLTADTDHIASKDSVQLVYTNLMEETKNRLSADADITGKLFKGIKSDTSGNKTTYTYYDNAGKTIGTTNDYDTKFKQATMIFTDTKDSSVLTWTGVDNIDNVFMARVDGIASREWVGNNYYNKTDVDAKIKDIKFTDTNTKIRNNKLSFNAKTGLLTSQITDTDGTIYNSNGVTGIASRDYVDSKIKEVTGGITDTNTKNASMSGSLSKDGKLTVGITDTDGNNVSTTINGVASKDDISNVNNKVTEVNNRVTNVESDVTTIKNDITTINNRLDNLTDNDTVTTVSTGDDWLHNETTETENGFDNKLTFNEDKLKDYIKDNSQDTITTVAGSGLAKVTESKTDKGYHYVIDVDADVVKDIAKSVDTNTTNKSMESVRDSEIGTATISVIDSDNNVVSTTIEDVASHKELKDYKESNDRDKEVMREVINNNSERIGGLESKVNTLNENVKEVGAHAAALAALHPLDYDEDDKFTFAAGMGNYRGKNACAIGAFYRPNEDTMFNFGTSFGSGDGMINLGASFKLGPTPKNRKSKKELIEELDELKAQVAELHEVVQSMVQK